MVRKSELQDATWDEVDFENAVWTIPKERMKRSKAHNVYLSRQTLDIHDRAEDMRRKFAVPVAIAIRRGCPDVSRDVQSCHLLGRRAGEEGRAAPRAIHGS
jgi:integrase